MRTAGGIAVALLALTWVALPRAGAEDSLSGLRGVLKERQHRIVVTLAPGHATLVVQRTVENLGQRHDQADWQLDIPPTSVATRLRTRGLLNGVPHWFEGELMEAEAAAAKYRELTGVGGYYPKDPALLSWRTQQHLALQVFPVAPGQPKTVSYTLQMPTEYRDGRHYLTLPALGTADLPAEVIIRARDARDRVFVNGQPFAAGGRLATGTADAELALAPAWAPPLGAALGGVRLWPDRALVHYHIEAAPRLGRIPRGAQLVVILDWSRSLDESLCRDGVAGAAAFLGHFKEASVEVLTVDRQARRRFGHLAPVGEAIAALGTMTIERRNGSALDTALAQADALLAQAPGGHPRRVLLFSELRTRSTLKVASLAGALRRSGALLHVVHIDEGRPSLEPDFAGDWSAVAERSGGLQWNASLVHGDAEAPNGEQAAMLEELARPVRIHRFRFTAPWVDSKAGHGSGDGSDFGADRDPAPHVLNEGQGVTSLQFTRGLPRTLEIAGQLWARPIRLEVSADPTVARRWSALVFGSELLGELDEREMMILARHGGAVSPVTSYLAIEPGVRPSTEGITEGEGGLSGGADTVTVGSSFLCGSGKVGEPFDHAAWLRRALEPAGVRCGFAGAVNITIETTVDEIVDVPAVTAAGPGDRTCLREAAWSLELPSAFTSERETWTVSLDP